MNKKPPKIPGWLLKKLSFYTRRYAVYEDLEEEYRDILIRRGKLISYLWFWFHTLIVFGEYINLSLYRSGIMFKNYIKISYRNLIRSKAFTLINISGLTVGIACFILIMLFIQYEYSFDKFLDNGDNIYRVCYEYITGSYQGKNHYASNPPALAPALMEEFPEVKIASRINVFPLNDLLMYNDFTSFENGIYADENFLNVLSYKVIKGDRNTALSEPNSIMLSESLADKIFKNDDAMGKIIRYRDEIDLKVTGVFQDLPGNSHLRFDFLLSINSYSQFRRNGDSWQWYDHHTYIILQDGVNIEEFNIKITDLFERKRNRKGDRRLYLQALDDIHFETHYNYNIAVTIDRKYIYMFSVTAFLILIIACINFMNLSTARSFKRAGEIGIRKVVGARRSQLIRQYFGESLIQTILSIIIALSIVYAVLPFFNNIVNRHIEFDITHMSLLFPIIGALIITGIIAGIYPALFISSFKPVNTLKGIISAGRGNSTLRNGLVLLQFGISILLIICTVIVLNQLHYIRNKDIGFNREHIVVIPVRDDGIRDNHEIIKDSLLENSNVVKVSCSGTLPLMRYGGMTVDLKDDDGNDIKFRLVPGYGDLEFIDLFEIEVIAGRKLSKEYGKDLIENIIINETALEILGWKEPFEKEFDFNFYGREGKARVVGIIKDTHYWSLHTVVEPYAFYIDQDNISYISVKISPQNISDTISYIKEIYDNYNSAFPFDYYFLDDRFNQQYLSEEKFGSLFSYFSGLAIFIACLGLIGLTAFSVERKTKEIGIRKVLGSDEIRIVSLISKEFVRLILIANVFAWPVAYFIMNIWLQKFAYRIDIGPGIFLLSALMVLTFAIITISYQTIKAAVANPVESLRYE